MRKSGWERDFESRERFIGMMVRRGKWRVRPYAPGDEAGILALFRRVFGSTSTLEQWRWRTRQHPSGDALIFVTEEKQSGKLIGHIAAIPTDLKVGDFLRKGFFLVDSAVDRSYRGKGITAVLTLAISKGACEKDGGFGFGLPNEQAYLPTLKTGAITLFTMSLFLKVLDWPKLLRTRLRPAFFADAAGGLIQLFRRRKRRRSHERFSIEEASRFGGEADDLWQRSASQFPIAAVRTATTLNWRYFECPGSPYRAFSISADGKWQGYIVIRTLQKWGLKLGTVVDLFVDPDCAQAGELLLCHAEAKFREEGVEALWGLFAAPEQYRKLLRDAGFFKIPKLKGVRRFHFVAEFVTVDHLRPDLAARDGALLRQGDQWFLSLGDTDLA